jgi:hypothetical protein
MAEAGLQTGAVTCINCMNITDIQRPFLKIEFIIGEGYAERDWIGPGTKT